MKPSQTQSWQVAVVGVGISLLAGGLPARAEAPGLYYSWRTLEEDLTSCIDRSAAALTQEALTNIQIEGNSISGNTETASAAFVCMTEASFTTVMIMVSSVDDETAVDLREALKAAY